MSLRRLSLLLRSLLLATLVACAQSNPPRPGIPKVELRITAATVAWRCGHQVPGGACSPGPVEPMQIDPIRFSCSACQFWMLASVAFGNMHPAAFKPNPQFTIPDLYNVQIVFAAPVSRQQLMLALQQVLQQAFGFAWHKIEQPSPVYRLVVGKNGPRFPAGTPPPFALADAMAGIHRFASMSELVKYLNSDFYVHIQGVDHPVEDGTGLKGSFNIQLDTGVEPGMDVPILSLVKEQLGLNAVLTRGFAEYIAIDNLHRLTGKWTEAQ